MDMPKKGRGRPGAGEKGGPPELPFAEHATPDRPRGTQPAGKGKAGKGGSGKGGSLDATTDDPSLMGKGAAADRDGRTTDVPYVRSRGHASDAKGMPAGKGAGNGKGFSFSDDEAQSACGSEEVWTRAAAVARTAAPAASGFPPASSGAALPRPLEMRAL